MAKIKDDKITIIDRDIDKMRARPTVYIGYLGEAGCLHLCKEIIDNNRDECLKPESPGDTVSIEITDTYIRSRDNGRGIPTELLKVVHETNQAGSNMTRSHGMTAGENGTGTTTYTAMSSELIVTTLRPQEKKKLTLTYREGVLIDEVLEEYTGKDHGIITTFKPSKKILGVNKIPVEALLEWIDNFNYTLPNKIHMNYTVNGERHIIKHIPIYEYFNKFIKEDERLCEPLVISCEGNLQEVIQGKTYDRTFTVEAAVMYSHPSYKGEEIRKSWMNMIYTHQNGMHVNGVINGLSRYLIEKAVKKNKRLEDEDLKKDVLSNLHVVVKAECNMGNMFDAQAKGHVFPKILLNAVTNAVYEALGEMNQSRVNDLVDVVISNNRVRREGEKARTIASSTRALKTWTKPASFIPCSSIKTEQPKELFLVEGNSAGGGLRGARDPKYQAILMFRGKSLNVWDEDLTRVLKSEPWLNLVKVLGCGIGPSFDIKKLNFDKIIITTDADIDGYHIRVQHCSFFLKFMPEIIDAGKLYIAEPPLYKLVNGKDISYVASQTEYIQKCIDSIGDIEISFPNMK